MRGWLSLPTFPPVFYDRTVDANALPLRGCTVGCLGIRRGAEFMMMPRSNAPSAHLLALADEVIE
jgi:hypothetical protein